jgi:hypothetical protein
MAFIGFFYEKSADLWAAITPIMPSFWLYVADEHTVQNVRSVLKPFSQNGEVLPSIEFGLREQFKR